MRRLALAALVTLTGHAAMAAPLQGQGFTLTAPAGGGWTVISDKPASLVFQARANLPYVLTAGAQAYADAGLAEGITPGLARAWLARRLRAPGRDSVALDVAPAELHGAHCVAYDAIQVDHDDPGRVLPDHVDDRMEYVQHGLLCAHPRAAGRQVQVFYNERFPRDGAPERRATPAAVRAFFERLQWDLK